MRIERKNIIILYVHPYWANIRFKFIHSEKKTVVAFIKAPPLTWPTLINIMPIHDIRNYSC